MDWCACGRHAVTLHLDGSPVTCPELKNCCDRCGKELGVGEWPWCPHGKVTSFGEEPLTPYFDEMVSEEGREFRTRGERRAFMAKNNLDYHDVSKKARGKRLYFDMRRG